MSNSVKLIKSAIICTRSNRPPKGFNSLLDYFTLCNIPVIVQRDKRSIFSAYSEAVNSIKDLGDDDILIFCHDDIEILNKPSDFLDILRKSLIPGVGFVGVAGTRYLGKDAVWWNHENWGKGLHRGFIFHGENKWKCYPTGYTQPRGVDSPEVVVLDGVFLAANVKTIKALGNWEKPEYFHGDWDFYDIHFTHKAHKLGLTNKVVPIILVHNSSGELVGRDSWIANQKAFISNTDLPELII